MGTDIDRALEYLWNHLCWLRLKWATYDELFGHSDERIEMLNRRTAHVVGTLQETLLDAVVLEVTALLDPAAARGQANMSFEGAAKLLAIDEAAHATLVGEIRAMKAALLPLVERRHARIAHRDREVALARSDRGGVSRAQVREAVEAVCGFYDRLHNAHTRENGETRFDLLGRDAASLVGQFLEVVDRGNAQLDREARERRAAWVRAYGEHAIGQDFDPGEQWRDPNAQA